MSAFMFGETEMPLYGVYHSPVTYQANERAFLICMPLGYEYYKAYSALRLLADELARQGHHTLRFCYTGTGDSSGESSDFSVEQALNDIQLAQTELKELSGLEVCSIFGLRFGATLGALSAQDTEYDKLIFWDPIISGDEYIQSLTAIHAEVISDDNRFLGTYHETERFPEQLVGHSFSSQLVQQINAINLRNIERLKVNSLSVFSTVEDDRVDNFAAHCKEKNSIQTNIEKCSPVVNWQDTSGIEKMIHPGSCIETFVAEANK